MSANKPMLIAAKALPHQIKFVNSTAKFPALVSGLGAGKTEALVYRVLKLMREIPKSRIGIYEPTVDLLKRIIYPRFEDIFANSPYKYKLNKSDGIMEVWMPNGKHELIFRSMDNYTRIIGYETHHAILDEIDTLSKAKAFEVWIRVLARNRKRFITKDGLLGSNTVGITTTPEGFNFVYQLWVKEHKNNPDYELIRGRTVDNFFLPPDYIKALIRTYPPQLIRAYLNGEFVNLIGNTVYDGFDRINSHTNLTMDDFPPTQGINIGMDFNINRMAAAVIMKATDPEIKRAYVVAEFHHITDTPAMIQAIKRRYPDRSITIFPDASGNSRKSVDASKSDIRLLREAGFRINAPRKNPPVRQRVLSTNTMFLNGAGERHLFVNVEQCSHTAEQLEKQIYDKFGAPLKDGDEDILDALGYAIDRVHGLARPTTKIARMRFST